MNERLSLNGIVKQAQEVPCEVISIRELTQEDILTAIAVPLGASGETPQLRHLRSSHHQLARLLALGKKPAEVSLITGYSASRISILQNDPAFRDLLAHYAAEVGEIHSNMVGRLASMTTDTIDLLHERLIDAPETFTNGQLTELLKAGADRSDAPPVTKSINLNQNQTLDVSIIHQIKQEISSGEIGNVKFVERGTNTLSQTTLPQDNSKFDVGKLMQEPSIFDSIEEETERLCGARPRIPAESGEAAQTIDSTGRVVWNPERR